eukprot:symbB.v1.2.037927.t1/scaffold5742.1/size24057/2
MLHPTPQDSALGGLGAGTTSGNPCWVTVFGFPGRAAAAIRQQLEAVCGPIVEVVCSIGTNAQAGLLFDAGLPWRRELHAHLLCKLSGCNSMFGIKRPATAGKDYGWMYPLHSRCAFGSWGDGPARVAAADSDFQQRRSVFATTWATRGTSKWLPMAPARSTVNIGTAIHRLAKHTSEGREASAFLL